MCLVLSSMKLGTLPLKPEKVMDYSLLMIILWRNNNGFNGTCVWDTNASDQGCIAHN